MIRAVNTNNVPRGWKISPAQKLLLEIIRAEMFPWAFCNALSQKYPRLCSNGMIRIKAMTPEEAAVFIDERIEAWPDFKDLRYSDLGVRPTMAHPGLLRYVHFYWKLSGGKDSPNDVHLNRWLMDNYGISAMRFIQAEQVAGILVHLDGLCPRKSKRGAK